MSMILSDYVAEFIVKQGVKDVFLLSGGGMMHLLDGVGRNPKLYLVCNLNEQASSICADSYGQFTNELGVCMLTTGPGATNAVTGITAAFLDSTPVLAISGQCKTADLASKRGVRQFGAQEVDIVSMVKPVTKYAVMITDKNSIRYHLEKAVFLAKAGRRGPVWIDIPLDIQGSQIKEEELIGFVPVDEGYITDCKDLSTEIGKVYQMINAAQRPAFLIGHGLVAAGAKEKFRDLILQLQIPVLATWRAKGVFGDVEELFLGEPGIPAKRYANYVLQNSDLVIIIGTRLNAALTAYDEKNFGVNAKKVIVDIDINEINKLDMNFAVKIHEDAAAFIEQMLTSIWLYKKVNRTDWTQYCMEIKAKYPLDKEIQPEDNKGLTDAYYFAGKLADYCTHSDVIVGASSGRVCGISHMAFQVKQGQRFVSSMGLGSMGFVVPSMIACCLASGRQRTLALEGDGSLQHNIQELALINTYKLPIKLFILSNGGYASIYMMQKNNFKGNYVACNGETNVKFPSLIDIAKIYQLDYYKIGDNSEVEAVLTDVMKDDRPVLCEVVVSIYFDEIPKSKTIVQPDGTFSSSKLENLYPFLPADEVQKNMPVWSNEA